MTRERKARNSGKACLQRTSRLRARRVGMVATVPRACMREALVGRALRARRVAGWQPCRIVPDTRTAPSVGYKNVPNFFRACGRVATAPRVVRALRKKNTRIYVAKLPRGSLGDRALPALRASVKINYCASKRAAWRGCDCAACEVGRDLRARRVAGLRQWRVLRALRAKKHAFM